MNGQEVDLEAINGGIDGDAGVAHGACLIAFTEAVMAEEAGAIDRQRKAVRAVLTHEELVDTCAVIASFNTVDRIADATGIPLDAPMLAMSSDVRAHLRLARFASAANTPGQR